MVKGKGEKMERLTRRDKENKAYWDGRNGAYSSDVYGRIHGNAIDKLSDYEDAEEQGLLLRLPCPVGTTVYCIEDECEDIYIEGSDYRFVGEERFDFWMLEQFGKTVFLTQEEAEQALKQMGE